jgi:hypothetical protein
VDEHVAHTDHLLSWYYRHAVHCALGQPTRGLADVLDEAMRSSTPSPAGRSLTVWTRAGCAACGRSTADIRRLQVRILSGASHKQNAKVEPASTRYLTSRWLRRRWLQPAVDADRATSWQRGEALW